MASCTPCWTSARLPQLSTTAPGLEGPAWIEGAAQVRQRNLRCRVTPLNQNPVWQPQDKMTMSDAI